MHTKFCQLIKTFKILRIGNIIKKVYKYNSNNNDNIISYGHIVHVYVKCIFLYM